MPQVTVPDLVGSTQSEAETKLQKAHLTVGPVTKVPSDKPSSSVLSTNPSAGSIIDEGGSVSLQISSGSSKVTVPPIVGLTQPAAEALLKSAGLAVGVVKRQHSNTVPAGGISNADQNAGALVNAGTPINLQISDGPESGMKQYIPVVLFVILGLVVLGIIVYAITQTDQQFLIKLSEPKVARGLITFLIAITTVGIAVILAVSTLVLSEGDAGDKRFDRGKQVLTTLIGVLGTIVGFYFGSANESDRNPPPREQAQVAPSKITTTSLPQGTAKKPFPKTALQAAGLTPPLKWSVAPSLPPGLSWDTATGTIDGTPTTPTPKSLYKFTVVDSAVPPVSSTTDLNLEIK